MPLYRSTPPLPALLACSTLVILLLTFGVVFDTIAVSPTIALIADMVLSVGLTPRALSNRS